MSRQEEVAEELLELGAVTISPREPFTWSSGMVTPIYCDNRVLVSNVGARGRVAEAFEALLEEKKWQPEVIAGVATAGIPHAAWLADNLALPMVYVRSEVKGHGRRNRIEGRLNEGDRVVVIEDLISTGGSSLAAVEALREAGAEVLGVAAIFEYGLQAARKRFATAKAKFATLTDLDTLLEVVVKKGGLSSADQDTVRDWRDDMSGWSKAHGGI